jgi:hypothetical protein
MTLSNPEGDWITEARPPLPPPTITVWDEAADAVMRELPDISHIDAHRAVQAAIRAFLGSTATIVNGGKEKQL